MNERDLWMAVRRALLMIVRAIEKHFDLRKGKK